MWVHMFTCMYQEKICIWKLKINEFNFHEKETTSHHISQDFYVNSSAFHFISAFRSAFDLNLNVIKFRLDSKL